MMVASKTEKEKKKIKFGLILVSDSKYEKRIAGIEPEYETVPVIERILKNHNQELTWFELVPNDSDLILNAISKIKKQAEILLIVGGTGIHPEEKTIETIWNILDKQMDGFNQMLYHLIFKEIGGANIGFRSLAGVSKNKLIFCLPKSIDIIKIGLREIILKQGPALLKGLI